MSVAPVLDASPLDDIVRRLDTILAGFGTGNVHAENVIKELLTAISDSMGLKQPLGLHNLSEVLPNPDHRRVVLASLVRLTSLRLDWEGCEFLRPSLIRAIEDLATPGFLKSLGLSKEQQSHEKLHRLQQCENECLHAIHEVIDEAWSLDRLNVLRQSLMRALHNERAKAVLQPFMPPRLWENCLRSVFENLELLVKESSRGSNVNPTQIQSARDGIEEMRGSGLQYGTVYSRTLLPAIARCLLNALDSYASQLPSFQEPRVSLAEVGRRYPLEQVGRQFDVVISLTNTGGIAYDAALSLETSGESEPLEKEVFLGTLDKGSRLVKVPVRVNVPNTETIAVAHLRFRTIDGRERSVESPPFELRPQKANVPWADLERARPYSLEPVTNPTELAGRKGILSDLAGILARAPLGSAYLYGQRRVGKTSIARAVAASLPPEFVTVYVTIGEYRSEDPRDTVYNLARRVLTKLRQAGFAPDPDPQPDRDGSIRSVLEAVQTIHQWHPEAKFVLILDEFDDLPDSLIRSTPIGATFYQSMRALTEEPYVGVLLVGGENMPLLLNDYGVFLNRFKAMRVDYFDWATEREDYKELVSGPVKEWLEFSDDAYWAVYGLTSGNPYFTKLICATLYERLVANRQAYADQQDIEAAWREAMRTLELNSFQHFLDDGLYGSLEIVERLKRARRRVVVALGEAYRQGTASESKVLEIAAREGIDEGTGRRIIREFERRGVLVKQGEVIDCRVRLFRYWLEDRGVQDIITAHPDEWTASQLEWQQEYVGSGEIVDVTSRIGAYRGRQITEDRVRRWLEQFVGYREQRLMFTLLKHINFYDGNRIRTKLREAHGIVSRSTTIYLDERNRPRNVFAGYLGGAGKSGHLYARWYRDELKLRPDNALEFNNPSSVVEKLKKVEDPIVVIVDDFIGTGSQAIDFFTKIADWFTKVQRELSLGPRTFLVAIAGFEHAKDRVETELARLGVQTNVHICDPIGPEDKCFAENNRIFEDERSRREALEIALREGRKLWPEHPLGFEDSQCLIVFSDSCPNNTLPIFWSSREWFPLFER